MAGGQGTASVLSTLHIAASHQGITSGHQQTTLVMFVDLATDSVPGEGQVASTS